MRAKAEVLRVVRAVLTLSLMQPRPRLPTLSGTRPWLPTLSVTPLRPAEHYHTYGELELNRKTPWFACKVLVQHDCTHSQRKPCIPISAMSWSAACKIVVLGPSSAACGNVAAMRDVLVLPIRVGRAGYQKETNMEHAVSALGAAGV